MTSTTELVVQGMTCGACSAAVTQALEGLPLVESASVSLLTNIARVEHNGASNESLLETIESAGFDAEICNNAIESVTIKIFGMTCAACSSSIEKALYSLGGVTKAEVNLITEQACIEYEPEKVGIRSIIKSVEDGGFDTLVASAIDNSQQIRSLQRVEETLSHKRDTLISLVITVPVFIMNKFRSSMPSLLTLKLTQGLWLDDIISLFFVSIVQFYVGQRFYKRTWRALKSGALNMDVLVTTSTTCAYAYSLGVLFYSVIAKLPGHQMYLWETSAMIILFISMGKWLENRARGATSSALSSLLSLAPQSASLELPDGSEKKVSTELLEVNDIVLLRPGERIPADGVVLSGESRVSESMLTGEAIPVSKNMGSQVYGGTINGNGSLRFKVMSCGHNTKLAQIAKLVKDAQSSKAGIQRYADYLASKFVPGVLLLATITFIAWFLISSQMRTPPHVFRTGDSKFFVCLRICISVIVVACPCALGLATPTAVMVASGVGAKFGILVKGGPAFEALSAIDVVLFDKTGTLTEGKLSVKETNIPEAYFSLIAAIERRSEHPVGKALVNHFERDGVAEPEVEQFTNYSGRGVEASVLVDGKPRAVKVGSHRLAQDMGFKVEPSKSNTDIYLIVDEQLVGYALLSDSLRSEAPDVVELLVSQGVKVGIISGDNSAVVKRMGESLHLSEDFLWGDQSPQGKISVIKDLQAHGHYVAMVGDGVNDSPALATAAVGISLEGATHVAVESADVVLVRSNPISAVPAALDLGRAAVRRIKCNLFVSMVYNAIMLPFAMGIFLPLGLMLNPMAASAAMAASSVSVVMSSLLLNRWSAESVKPSPKHWFSLRSLWKAPQHDYIPLDSVPQRV